jgi:hypothetical protein
MCSFSTNKSTCGRCDFSKLILIFGASLHVGVHIENDQNIKPQFPKVITKIKERMAGVSPDRQAWLQSHAKTCEVWTPEHFKSFDRSGEACKIPDALLPS